MDRSALLEFLRRQRYGVVSSLSDDGFPQSAVVGIAITQEFEIIFDTTRQSRKYRNLISRPAGSLVCWEGEKTVQFEGIAVDPSGDNLERYREVYFSAWPDGRERLNWNGIVHLVLRPRWIRYSDFSQTSPQIEEFTFENFTF